MTTSKEIEPLLKKFPTNKSPAPGGFVGEVYQAVKEELIPILLILFQKTEEEGVHPNSFGKAGTAPIPQPRTHEKRITG